MNLDDYPNEMIEQICLKMDDDSLYNFMTTSSKMYDVCFNIIQKRRDERKAKLLKLDSLFSQNSRFDISYYDTKNKVAYNVYYNESSHGTINGYYSELVSFLTLSYPIWQYKKNPRIYTLNEIIERLTTLPFSFNLSFRTTGQIVRII